MDKNGRSSMTKLEPEPLLVELARQVLDNWQSTEMERRRRLWRALFRLERVPKIPVKCAVYESYDLVWQQMIPEDKIVFKEGMRRHVELLLRIKLEKFRRLRDDDVIWPTLWASVDRGRGEDGLWGVPLKVESTGVVGGAYKPIPPIRTEADLERIRAPEVRPRPDEERRVVDEMTALTDGLLPVKINTDELHYGPYEWAVRMRGAEQLMYDFYDRPEWAHRLMDRITSGMVAYHKAREAAGMFDAEVALPRVHEPYDEIPPDRVKRLDASWCYVHAQSAAPLGPEMYAEFVHPYNARIAALFGKVYYHGCEDLGKKAAIIRDLPHLLHFHVSPWTQLEEVVPVFRGRRVVLEVHCHPTEVLFTYGPKEMRAELRRRIAEAEDMPFDLKLCDIQTIKGAEGQLERWTDIAMEEAGRRG